MSTRNRNPKNTNSTRPNAMQPSPISSTKSRPSELKTSSSAASSLPLPDELKSMSELEAMSTLTSQPSQSQSQSSSSQNPNPSQKNGTSGSSVSAGAKRKLTADEVKFEKLNQDLKDNIGSIGGLLLVLGQARHNEPLFNDGLVVMQHNEKLSSDLVNLAKKYEWVYNGLNSMVQATVWGAVIGEVAAITLAIASNHGMSSPGLSSPEGLEQAA